MEFRFEREVNICRMCIETKTKPGYTMKMVCENSIDMLLRTNICELNNEIIYSYDITSLISVSDYYEKKELQQEDIKNYLGAMNKLLNSMDEYLLDSDCIILEPDKIFINISDGSWHFAYNEENNQTFEAGMKLFAEFLIQHVCHKDNFAVTLSYGIYKKSMLGNISPRQYFEYESVEDNLKSGEVITQKKVNENIIPEIAVAEVEETDLVKLCLAYGIGGILALVILTGAIMFVVPSLRIGEINKFACTLIMILGAAGLFFGYRWFKENKAFFIKIKKTSSKIPFEDEHIKVIVPSVEQEDMTVMLGDLMTASGHEISWCNNGEKVKYQICDEVTVIGSAKERADCVIGLPGVSRMHARISKEGDCYYIKDLNSTNGTMVNGRELACFELCEIHSTDKIILGNVECVFN